MALTDNDLMPWGKHKGEAMANVPASYLVWCWEENELYYTEGILANGSIIAVMDYIKETGIDYLRKEAKNGG